MCLCATHLVEISRFSVFDYFSISHHNLQENSVFFLWDIYTVLFHLEGTLYGMFGGRENPPLLPSYRACCKVSGFDARKHRERVSTKSNPSPILAALASARVNIRRARSLSLVGRKARRVCTRGSLFSSPGIFHCALPRLGSCIYMWTGRYRKHNAWCTRCSRNTRVSRRDTYLYTRAICPLSDMFLSVSPLSSDRVLILLSSLI